MINYEYHFLLVNLKINLLNQMETSLSGKEVLIHTSSSRLVKGECSFVGSLGTNLFLEPAYQLVWILLSRWRTVRIVRGPSLEIDSSLIQPKFLSIMLGETYMRFYYSNIILSKDDVVWLSVQETAARTNLTRLRIALARMFESGISIFCSSLTLQFIQGQCGMGQWARKSCTTEDRWKFLY